MSKLSHEKKFWNPSIAKSRYSNDRPPYSRTFKGAGKRRLRYFYLRFLRMQGSSEAIARGLAAGVFMGMFPVFGFQILLGILLASIIQGNKPIAAAATWISNPLTYVPIFALNFHIGQWVLGTNQLVFRDLEAMQLGELLKLGPTFITTFLVGCVIMGTSASSVAYISGLWIVRHLRHQRRTQSNRKTPKC